MLRDTKLQKRARNYPFPRRCSCLVPSESPKDGTFPAGSSAQHAECCSLANGCSYPRSCHTVLLLQPFQRSCAQNSKCACLHPRVTLVLLFHFAQNCASQQERLAEKSRAVGSGLGRGVIHGSVSGQAPELPSVACPDTGAFCCVCHINFKQNPSVCPLTGAWQPLSAPFPQGIPGAAWPDP